MENDTFSGAILAWVKGRGAFLKVQAGTGDNLLEEDIREGFTDYCLWSTFRPESIDTDGELAMECLDSGMVLFREKCTPGEALESSYRQGLRQGRLLRHPERNVVESKDPIGGRIPLPAAPASPGLPDTPSPRSSAPKTLEKQKKIEC